MIPRVAWFYWTGGPLPWLRAQALATFARHHPGWTIRLGSPEDREAPPGVELVRDEVTDPRLPSAARSDVWRWHVLAEHGGLYADTDVLFLRSVEPLFAGECDGWLTTNRGTEVPGERVRLSIGVVAAQPGCPFFERLAELARGTPLSRDYQSHGTSLIAANWRALTRGVRLGLIPGSAFYRGSSVDQVRALWRYTGAFEGEYGLHWYGGSVESAPYLRAASTDELPECWVRRALGVSQGRASLVTVRQEKA